MTLLDQAIASGRFDSSGYVEVWLDAGYKPLGSLPEGQLPCIEIVVDRRQRIDALEFDRLAGQNVMIVSPAYSERMSLLADRIAAVKPESLLGVVLSAQEDEDPMLCWIKRGEHV
jgi:hypothetical protein